MALFCVCVVDFLDAVRQRVQKFEVAYIGNLPVSRAMGESLGRTARSYFVRNLWVVAQVTACVAYFVNSYAQSSLH